MGRLNERAATVCHRVQKPWKIHEMKTPKLVRYVVDVESILAHTTLWWYKEVDCSVYMPEHLQNV